MRALTLLVAIHLAAFAFLMSPLMAQTVPVSPFGSVELRNGGKVTLRHGPTQQITFVSGSRDYSSVSIESGGLLVIDKCTSRCPKGYNLEVEIVTPHLAKISVAHGGIIESRGNFPQQAEITVAVNNGGTIDLRSINAERVSASIDQGGRIFTSPRASMVASVSNGGKITYWGDAYVQSSVHKGGDVAKGEAGAADRPLSELR